MHNSLEINIVIPHEEMSGGIKAVSKIAKYCGTFGAEVNIIIPRSAIIMGCDIVSNASIAMIKKSIKRLARKEGTENKSKIGEWLGGEENIIRIFQFQPQFHDYLGSDIPDADITIATSWRTAYGVSKLPKSKGKKYYFMQGYEIWPVWQNKKYWSVVGQQYPNRDLTIQMANLTPNSIRDRIYKNYVDNSYDLDLDIIVTSEWEKDILEQHGVQPIGKVTLGVEPEFGRSKDIIENKNLTITGIYRDSMTKGDQELLNSFDKINSKYNNVDLIIFGPKKFNNIPSYINYYANPSDDQISQILNESDVFVFPSWVEGFGLPPLEAMACGCVVISTNVGAVQEYAPRNAVRFIPRNDEESIINGVEEYRKDSNLQKYKKEARSASKEYTWKETASEFLSIIS